MHKKQLPQQPSRFRPAIARARQHLHHRFGGCILFSIVLLAPIYGNAADIYPRIQQAFELGRSPQCKGTLPASQPKLNLSHENGVTRLTFSGEQIECRMCADLALRNCARALGVAVYTKKSGKKAATLDLTKLSAAPAVWPTVWIDGLRLPPSTRTIELIPSSHEVVVQQHGVTGIATVSLTPGKTVAPVASDFRFSHLFPGLLRLGVLGIAAGSALGGVGLSFIAIHESCASTQVLANGQCKEDHQTRIPGIVLSSLGVALIGTGVGLLLHRNKLVKGAQKQFSQKGRQ